METLHNVVGSIEVTRVGGAQERLEQRDRKADCGSRVGSGRACKELRSDDFDYAAVSSRRPLVL